MVWAKLKVLQPNKRVSGRRDQKEGMNILVNESNINQEYRETLRTKSYMEICNKVQDQLGTEIFDKQHSSSSSSSSSFSIPPMHVHLSECLLEPPQEVLNDIIKDSKLDYLLADYFNASLEATKICELLLQSVHQTRAHYRIIRRVIKQAKRAYDEEAHNYNDDRFHPIFQQLSRFSLLKSPLSMILSVQFHAVHETDNVLLRRLTSKHRKIRRRRKFINLWKKVSGGALVVAYIALSTTLIVLAIHSIAGVVAVPAVIGSYLGLFYKKRRKLENHFLKKSSKERLGAQLDVAAKGVFILINDFDTIGRLASGLHDELEHCKVIAGMAVRSGNGEVLKEVVREFQTRESWLLEILEELEEHIYLCFLTINKSRRDVLQQMMVLNTESSS